MMWRSQLNVGSAIFAGLLAVALGPACSSSDARGDQTRDAGSKTPDAATTPELGKCSWPDRFGPGSSCQAARGFFLCSIDGGGNLAALASGADALMMNSAYHFNECRDECAPTEYGLECSGLPDAAPTGDAPPSCRLIGGDPAHIATYCCPCGA